MALTPKATVPEIHCLPVEILQILEVAPVAFAIFRISDGRLLGVNDAFLALHGYERSEVIGRSAVELGLWADPRERADLLQVLERNGSAKDLPFRYRTKLGGTGHGCASALLCESEGEPCLAAFLLDVTERKRAEAQIRESEGLYRGLFEAESDAILVVDMTTERILDANAAARRLYGYTKAEFLAMSIARISDEAEETARAIRERSGFSPMRRHRRKDGTVFPVEITRIFFEFDGRSLHVAAIRDISERERIKKALVESEERMNLFIAHAPAALAMFDRDMRYLACSRRWLEDYDLGQMELLGRSHYEIFPEIPEHWKDVHRRGLDGEVIKADYERFLRRDGSTQWLRWEVWPWLNSEHQVGGIVVFTEDVTQARQREEQMRNLFQAVEQSPESIIITDLDARIEYANPAFTRTTGYALEEVLGRNPRFLQSGRTPSETYAGMWRALASGRPWKGEFVNRCKDGREFIELASISPVRGPDGTISRYVAVKEDISQRKAAEARIHFLAHHDALTGLPNRALARDRFEFALSYAERSKRRLSVMFADLDNFKSINDSLGHMAGDELLKCVAARFRACIRETDTLSRQGGDEFMIIMGDVEGLDDVAVVADKLIASLRAPIEIGGHSLTVTTSIGIAMHPDDGLDLETLMKKADMAMYVAKEGGGGHHRYFDDGFNVAAAETLALRTALRNAVDGCEFEVHYQPQINLATGHIVGAEALVRWQSPHKGLVGPAEFIGIAEDSGLIVQIGEWVLHEACGQAARWEKHEATRGLKVAVNLSAVQFARGNLESAVASALRRSGLDAARLELELTESTLIKNPESVLATVERLRRLGVTFAIDDFGTGYSSLAYLKRFPVQKLKIDQTFVRSIMAHGPDVAIVRAIIQMAAVLGMKTVAEGVEDAPVADYLRDNGCDEAQGYHFSRPLPADEFASFLCRRQAGAA